MTSTHIRRALLIGLFALLLVTLTPASPPAADAAWHSMDDALLLMFATQSRLYDDYAPQAALRVPGHAALAVTVDPQGASKAQINEQEMLADMYQGWADQLPEGNAVGQHLAGRADEHREQAAELGRVRRRYLRNRNPLQRAGRAIARPFAKAGQAVFRGGRWLFRGVGKVGRVAVIIARDEIILRAKQIVRAKVQDLIDIGRGKIDMVMARIARKWGVPAAELLREFVVNPAFKRLRAELNRNVDRLIGEQQDREAGDDEGDNAGDEVADEPGGEHQTDWDNVGEEGEGGYDTDDDDDTAAGDTDPADEAATGRYPVEDWFDEDQAEAACYELAGAEYAAVPMYAAEILDHTEGYSGGVDRHITVHCDFRDSDMQGTFFYVELWDTLEGASERHIEPVWTGYCEENQSYTWGEIQCGPHELVETRDVVDINGDVIEEILHTRLTTRDENAWIKIYLDPTQREGAVPRAYALAESIHTVLEARRGE